MCMIHIAAYKAQTKIESSKMKNRYLCAKELRVDR